MPSDPSIQPVVDDATRRATLVRRFHIADDMEKRHDMYHEDAILEFPQSGERFIGKQNFLEWRAQYPAEVRYRIRRLTGSGELWVTEVMISYSDGPWVLGVDMAQFRGDKIAREIIYVMDGWEAADWRTPWVTRFDLHASVDASEWTAGSSFGLEADLQQSLASGPG